MSLRVSIAIRGKLFGVNSRGKSLAWPRVFVECDAAIHRLLRFRGSVQFQSCFIGCRDDFENRGAFV